MDQDPKMQGKNPSPQSASSSTKDNPAAGKTTVTETVVTTETIPSSHATNPNQPMATEIVTETITEANHASPAVTGIPRKKSHKGIIALILTLLLVIILAAGAATWYFIYYSNPEKVASDAIINFLSQDTVISDGLMIGHGKVGSNNIEIIAGITSKNDGLAGEGTLNIKANLLDVNGELLSDNQYEVELGGIFMKNGVLYFRTGKLIETVDLILDDMQATVADLDEDARAVYNLLERIDGEWWQIDVADVIDNVVDDSSVASASKEFYTCLINAANKDNIKSQLVDVYNQHKFISLTKADSDAKTSGVSEYVAELDYPVMANFLNDLQEIDAAKNARSCIDKYFNEDLGINFDLSSTEITSAQLEDDLKPYIGPVTLSISDFGHQLQGVSTTIYNSAEHDDDNYVFAAFEFTESEVVISAPGSYRPVSELFELIMEAIMEANGIPTDDNLFDYDEETGEWYISDEINIDDNSEEI